MKFFSALITMSRTFIVTVLDAAVALIAYQCDCPPPHKTVCETE